MNTTNNQSLINLISEETNIETLNMERKTWDAEIGGVPYQVVRIRGYVHTLGGRYGACDLWAYPRAEAPSFKNLIQFNAYNPVSWGISYKPKNYMCYEKETRNSNIVTVTRNGQKFCTCAQKGINAGIDEARILISKFTKHPLGLNSIDYDKKAVGRPIYYRGVPAVIVRFLKEQAAIVIKAEIGFILPIYPFEIGMSLNKDNELKVDILDENIVWNRNESVDDQEAFHDMVDSEIEAFDADATFADLPAEETTSSDEDADPSEEKE